MKTQIPLLVLYVVFLLGSIGYVSFSHQAVSSTSFAPDSFQRMREGLNEVTTVERARQRMGAYISLIESSDQMADERVKLHSFYAMFAIVMTLPLAMYAGQSMRNKLFAIRPAEMPRSVYWALWGVGTRGAAVRYMWLSVLLALVSIAASFFHPIGFLGTAALISAAWYRHAIKWVDANSYWANATHMPFPPSKG